MRITTSDLSRVIPLLKLAMDSRPYAPILECIRITRVDDKHIAMTATDLDSELRLIVEAFDIPADLDVALPLCTLQAAALSPTSPAAVSLDTDHKVAEWPAFIHRVCDCATLDIGNADLHKALSWVSLAASNEEMRYYLKGVYLTTEGSAFEKTIMVATDGHRLHRAELDSPIENPAEMGDGAIIPAAAAKAICKVAGEKAAKGGSTRLDVGKSRIRAQIRDSHGTLLVDYRSKVIDGTFPDYGRVIPAPSGKSVAVDVKPAIAACKMAEVGVARNVSAPIKVDPAAGMIGDVAVSRLSHGAAGTPAPFAVNARHLRAAIDGAKEAVIDMESPQNPMRVTYPGDESRLAVIMPMRR